MTLGNAKKIPRTISNVGEMLRTLGNVSRRHQGLLGSVEKTSRVSR
jgi:hypothetical protein